MLGIPLKVGLVSNRKESGTEIGHSLEFDFVVPPPHNRASLKLKKRTKT